MVNIEKLKTAMKEKNITVKQASEAIGFDAATFYRRMQRHGEKLTVIEVEKLAALLSMDHETVQAVFFDKQTA